MPVFIFFKAIKNFPALFGCISHYPTAFNKMKMDFNFKLYKNFSLMSIK